MVTPTRTPISLEQISLRKAERGFVSGGSGSGKSFLADRLGAEFVQRYWSSGGRRLIVDSKGRYHATIALTGSTPRRRYRYWDHGPTIPASCVVDHPEDIKAAWGLANTRTIIVQAESEGKEIPRLVACVREFLRDSRAARPQVAQIDETMDFFHQNGSPIGGDDVVLRLARAGRERGTAALYCSQRTKGIPPQLMEELVRLYAFRLDFVSDGKRYQEMGAPPFQSPEEDFDFLYWYKRDRRHIWGPYRLAAP